MLMMQGLVMQSALMEGCTTWAEAWWTLCSAALGCAGSLVCLAGTGLGSAKGAWSSHTALALYTPAILLAFLATARTIIYYGALEASCLGQLTPADAGPCLDWRQSNRMSCGRLCTFPGSTDAYYLRIPATAAALRNRSLARAAGNASLTLPFLAQPGLASFCTLGRYWAFVIILILASITFRKPTFPG